MSFRQDGSASSQVVSFMVAGLVFLAAVAAVLLASRGPAGQDRGTTEATQQKQAERLADLLVNSQGVGWAAGGDGVQRLGIRAANGSGLSDDSLEALRGALFTAASNGKVDYPDARDSLGLTGTQDFHLRVSPVGMDSVYAAADSGIRAGYIGDWVALLAILLPDTSSEQEQKEAQASLNLTMFALTAQERAALRNLGLDFNDRVFISASAPTILVDLPLPTPDRSLLEDVNLPLIEGDVYPDVKSYLDANLPGRLANYDLLVVGSGVDQSSMTSSAVKFAVRDWVLAGGTLVVLGSESLNYQWLQPLFSVGVKTANGAASAPDPAHPLLQEPHLLDWTSYDHHGKGWDIKAQSAEGFSNVIVLGGGDVLAVSNDGALGSGRVILTTYLPREIAATMGVAEAEHFLENIVLFTDRTKLYLEYGPEQPTGIPVAVSVRQSFLYDPKLGQVPVRIEVHLWGEPT